jgi:hypothetical protein
MKVQPAQNLVHNAIAACRFGFNDKETLGIMSRQVVAWNPRDWGFAFESEVGVVVVVVLQEGFEGIAALV